MARAPRNKITKMTIREISAVDDPANQHATVDLFKAKGFKACDDCKSPGKCSMAKKCSASDEKAMQKSTVADAIAKGVEDGYFDPAIAAMAADILKENTMDDADIAKALAAADERLDTLEKANEAAEARAAAAEARADEAETKLAKALAGEGPTADEVDAEVMKSLPPAIRVRLEKAAANEEAIAKMLAEREEGEAIAKARAIGIGDAKVVGPLLVRIGKGMTTTDDVTTVEALLKAAAAQAAAGGLFKSVGAAVDEAVIGDANGVLKAKVEEIRKANPTMSAAEAEVAAYEANPALYSAVNKAKAAA